MNDDLIYVYCLSNGYALAHNLPKTNDIKVIEWFGYSIFVKIVSTSEFSEENLKMNISDLKWLDPNAREHIRVISKIMETCTVIPFKFGTIFKSEENLKQFVCDYSDSLRENLMILGRKEEWSVKIYCDRHILTDQIDELSEEAAALEKQIMASSPGKAFLMKRKKNELIENEINRLCKMYGQEFYNKLGSLSHTTCLNNLIPSEFTGRKEDMILNAAFLVHKDQTDEFLRTTKSLKKEYSGLGFDFETNGPWPPFTFISIKEKK
jgi:hypothetical protein